MDYGYYGDGAAPGWLIAFMLAFSFFIFIFGVAAYVVNSIFLMKLLRNAGHKTPVAAWVPIWNTVSLMQIGGIKQPWVWALIFVGGSFVAGLIPYIGFFISLGILVAAIIVTIYLAKGVQAGVGTGSTGGIVLAVLLPIIWVIWISLASNKSSYNRDAAIAEGSRMPWNWFGESDLYEPFGITAPVGSYAQPQGYAQPQSGYAPQQPQGYAPPAASYAPPVVPASPIYEASTDQPDSPAAASWTDGSNPTTSSFNAELPEPPRPPENLAPDVDLPIPPPAHPSPRSREELEDGDGNRTI